MLKSRQFLKEQFCQGCAVSDEILKLIYFKFKTDCEVHGFFVNPMCLFCYNVIMVMVLDRIKRMNNAKKVMIQNTKHYYQYSIAKSHAYEL